MPVSTVKAVKLIISFILVSTFFVNNFHKIVLVGVLLYSGRQRADEGDFVSLSLVNQRLQLRFNLGNGLAVITCANLPQYRLAV